MDTYLKEDDTDEPISELRVSPNIHLSEKGWIIECLPDLLVDANRVADYKASFDAPEHTASTPEELANV